MAPALGLAGDGRNQTLAGAGVPLMAQYRDAGLDMMHEHAQFEDGGSKCRGWRARDARSNARRTLEGLSSGQNDDWLEEYSMYHRKDGLLVKEGDDAISASRYALMMKRHGQSDAGRASFNREIVYPRQSIA